MGYTYLEANASSLPWSLRHSGGPSEIIREARDIAALLYDATYANTEGDSCMGDTSNGLRLCPSLLIDKLDIAAGDYLFPTVGHSDDHDLCMRVKR